MPTANSLSELEAMLQKEMFKAMQEARDLAEQDVKFEGLDYFYMGGFPKLYKRTYQMAHNDETTEVIGGGNFLYFSAGMTGEGGYSTGKNPSMMQVLNLTNDGSYPGLQSAVGSPGWWDKAKAAIEKDVDATFAKHFPG